MIFQIHKAYSQKYLNEKDRLFGFITWYDFSSKFMAPLILGGAFSNLTNNSFSSFFVMGMIVFVSIFIFEKLFSKSFQILIISRFLHPKRIVVSKDKFRGVRNEYK